ncbi:hypothetical protein AHAS_Ahas11G0176600 [Arachis hypogaea]
MNKCEEVTKRAKERNRFLNAKFKNREVRGNGAIKCQLNADIKTACIPKKALIQKHALIEEKRSTFKSCYKKESTKCLSSASLQEVPKLRTRPRQRRPSSSRGTVHTLGRATRPGMIGDKATDLFRYLPPSGGQGSAVQQVQQVGHNSSGRHQPAGHVYVDFWEMEPSDSDFFRTDSDEEFPRGDDLDFLDDDSKVDEDRPQDKRIAELSREDIMQLQFTDEEAVYRFYKTYAMMHSFAVRLDEVRPDSDGCVIMRQIVCNWASSRMEEVVSFYKEHSHGLVDPLDVSMMPEYHTFSVSDKAQAKNLHDIGIRTCHILGYLAA